MPKHFRLGLGWALGLKYELSAKLAAHTFLVRVLVILSYYLFLGPTSQLKAFIRIVTVASYIS